MSEKFHTARRTAPVFVLSLLAMSFGCAEGADDPLSVDRSAVTVGKSDNMAPSCSLATGSAEHQAYCLALSFDACEADAAC